MATSATKDVLIVDDDPTIRQLVQATLSRVGLECDEASDGVHAIEQLTSARYAVILLDLMMPRLDGAGVLKTMRLLQLAEEERPLVLVLTASTDHAGLEDVGEMVQVVIKKPFDIHELGGLVRECVVARQTVAQQARSARPRAVPPEASDGN